MAAGGEWGWSDFSTLGSFGGFMLTLAGLVHLHGRHSKNTDVVAASAKEAREKADAVAADFAAYKVEAVEKFVPRLHLEQMENRIIQRIDKQDERNDATLRQIVERSDAASKTITERLDRILESRQKV